MIDNADNRFGTCENCGHPIREVGDGSGKYMVLENTIRLCIILLIYGSVFNDMRW